MTTLLLSARYSEDSIVLAEAANLLSWQTRRIHNWEIPAGIDDSQYVLYGEQFFVLAIAEKLGLSLLEAPFDWLTNLPTEYLNRKIEFTTLKTLKQKEVKNKFIKPADDKCFKARIYASSSDILTDFLPDDSPILVSEPVDWDIEFRTFFRHHEPVTMSLYLRNGKLVSDWQPKENEYKEALQFVNQISEDPRIVMSPGAVIDIGYIRNRGWAIIESNPAYSSGIYRCSPEEVLLTIKESIKQK